MPSSTISNPYGVNVAQGDTYSLDKLIQVVATDPAGNANTITGMTTANPTVITTNTAHGFISGKQVNINAGTAFSATGTVPNGNYTATVLSATTFSIPYNYTGTYTSGGAVYQLFQQGQCMAWQTWSGTASGAASAPAYPTVTVEGLTADFAIAGILLGANAPGGGVTGQGVPLGGLAQIVVSGSCTAYFDATPTALTQVVVSSAAHPGCVKSAASGVSGKNVGIPLQAVTVSTAYLPVLGQVVVKLS